MIFIRFETYVRERERERERCLGLMEGKSSNLQPPCIMNWVVYLISINPKLSNSDISKLHKINESKLANLPVHISYNSVLTWIPSSLSHIIHQTILAHPFLKLHPPLNFFNLLDQSLLGFSFVDQILPFFELNFISKIIKQKQ